MDNRNAGVSADISLGIGLSHLLHSHVLLLGNVVDIPGIEDDCVLVDAAFPAPAALEPKLGIQVQQVILQMLNALTSLHHFEYIHMFNLHKIKIGVHPKRMYPLCHNGPERLRCYLLSASMYSNSSSVRIFTPRLLAFSSLLPAFSPAMT